MNIAHKTLAITALALSWALTACGGSQSKAQAGEAGAQAEEAVSVPAFNADSAYAYVAAQTAMGPRVPGTAAHRQCRDWMAAMLKGFGADTVWVQRGSQDNHRGGTAEVNNVIARFNLKSPRRVLLLAHYDTRPWADEDPDAANHSKPIDGANDGASGVGVIMEIARQAGMAAPGVGVDVLMADVEDSGTSGNDAESDLTWCLGTQYFAQNLPYTGRLPEAAVLLDMVGGKDAVFPQEYFSQQAAGSVVNALWQAAERAGYGARFPKRMGGAVNDDHVPLIGAGIKAVDIIECGNAQTGSFNPTWHTMADNLDNIATQTLTAVGQTVMQYIYGL